MACELIAACRNVWSQPRCCCDACQRILLEFGDRRVAAPDQQRE